MKWKIAIISPLTFGKKRFKELQGDVDGINAKMIKHLNTFLLCGQLQ